MAYVYTGEKGKPLKDIIFSLGNRNYDYIECRCKWVDKDGKENDDLFGECSYKDGILNPLDGDTYSLDDLYIEYKERFENNKWYLAVWEAGYLSNERKC